MPFRVIKSLRKLRIKSENSRQQENRPHEVLYFHKVDDPYSHLTIQYIDKFRSSFDVTFKAVLVGEEQSEAVHEPSLYSIHIAWKTLKKLLLFMGLEFSADLYPFKRIRG